MQRSFRKPFSGMLFEGRKMIHKLSIKYTDFIISQGAKEQQREVYIYGMECFLNLLVSDLLLYGFGFLTGNFLYLFLWSVSFLLLRINIGGIHAPAHWSCILSGFILGLSTLLFNHVWAYIPLLMPVVVIAAFINIGFLAPAVHENHPVSDRQKRRARKKAFLILMCETMIAAGCFLGHYHLYQPVMSGIFFQPFYH